jgi:hypothetical protein
MDQQNPPELDPSFAPLSGWLKQAVRWRFVLLGCYLILTVAWYCVFCSVRDPLGLEMWDSDGHPILVFLAGQLVLLGAQCLFLLGAPHLHWPRPRRRRSMFISLAAGSAVAVLLSVGIFSAGASLNQLVYHPGSFKGGSVTIEPTTAPAPPANSGAKIPWLFIGIAVIAWTLWFLIFALMGAGQWAGRFRRMYRTLIGGTILELLITIPIDVQVRKRTDCYCFEGTLISLAIGLTAIVWTFGPGVAILFLIRRNQIKAASGNCRQCGYDLRGLSSSRCPECGTPFRHRTIN